MNNKNNVQAERQIRQVKGSRTEPENSTCYYIKYFIYNLTFATIRNKPPFSVHSNPSISCIHRSIYSEGCNMMHIQVFREKILTQQMDWSSTNILYFHAFGLGYVALNIFHADWPWNICAKEKYLFHLKSFRQKKDEAFHKNLKQSVCSNLSGSIKIVKQFPYNNTKPHTITEHEKTSGNLLLDRCTADD